MVDISSSGFIQGLVQFLNPQDHPDIWKNLLRYASELESEGVAETNGDILEGI